MPRASVAYDQAVRWLVNRCDMDREDIIAGEDETVIRNTEGFVHIVELFGGSPAKVVSDMRDVVSKEMFHG